MQRILLALLLSPFLLRAQPDPALEAFKVWDRQHPASDREAHAASLVEASGQWVAKWPDSRFAWTQRRQSLGETQNRSPELWKQVDENLIRLNPPHSYAVTMAAYDWVTYHFNLKEAIALLTSEIAWHDSQIRPTAPEVPSLGYFIDEAEWAGAVFGSLCTLAYARIQLKEFDQARITLARIRGWLDGDFKRFFDQDPMEAFPDHESKFLMLSAELARAEDKKADALAFYRR